MRLRRNYFNVVLYLKKIKPSRQINYKLLEVDSVYQTRNILPILNHTTLIVKVLKWFLYDSSINPYSVRYFALIDDETPALLAYHGSIPIYCHNF